ncbi:MAG TPA: efflux RND transporter periplasmic adaptor subunit [Planctomycetaceae bacterium]|nr:efflux RND transporter periplasmic adaptor subunit [Planctomycetaceae bacterium]
MKQIAIFGILAAVLVGLLVYSQQRTGPVTVSGFVEADEIRVGSRVGGRVLKVLVEEGHEVADGDTLIDLEPFDLLERKAEAQQKLVQATAVLNKLEAGYRPEEKGQMEARRDQMAADLSRLKNGPRPQEIAAVESELRLDQAELELAQRNYNRIETLFGKQAADRNDLDEAQTKLRVAQAATDARGERLALLKEGTRQEDIVRGEAVLKEAEQQLAMYNNGYRSEDIQEAQAKRDAADAALRAIDEQIKELRIVSPCNGVVEALELRPGDLLAANVAAVSLMDSKRLWIRAFVPENLLDLRIGQPVAIIVDSFPGRRFAGEITFIARQAEFTPSNVQTPEERSRQVFRIKVHLTDGTDVLRPGMAADIVLSEKGSAR